MIHSKTLEDTMLWQNYQAKVVSDHKRSEWVKELYNRAAIYMKDVRQTFPNYTLHDETHILNVMDAMGGLLGDQISQLTVGEMELLILAACLHDIGMVYTDDDKKRWYKDEEACRKFLREYSPELLGCPAETWTEDMRQWYLRTLHPFRLSEVLQNEGWEELFARCPLEVVPKRCVIAVCQAHGENQTELYSNRDLGYLPANDVDPLFCVLLLRLGDLLDFDDTRAPKILYHYVACNEKSREEWEKHQASAGFRYPVSPSANDLPYKARCMSPGVEHAVRDFLDWIDEELGNCTKLQKHCRTGWQQEFSFPRAVLRDEIESDGYMSGDFCLTMDQTQVLNLLTGENLYDNRDVFIRELLQNAMDATLLRGKMDSQFIPEESRIDLWEWNDKEGNIWFRIDDQGTGMTLGMLQRYFLKVGNSYYNSKELERDLRDHGQTEKYNGISRFGIGFLSSFLCGDYAEVSTLYFDPDKNRREESSGESYRTVHYGLRLQVTGLSGYYTLKNQSKHHKADADGQFPTPDCCDTDWQQDIEREGYRASPGTSIAIRLNPGKLGALNLHKVTEKYLCGARVPVYYNNKRIGRTYEEVMQAAHEVAGEKIYELTPEQKKQFNHSFPAVCGQYPKLAVTVIPLDTEEDQVLPEFSGVIIKYDVRFDKIPQYKVKDQVYDIFGYVRDGSEGVPNIFLFSRNQEEFYEEDWKSLKNEYGMQKIATLEAEFEKRSTCPQIGDLIEEVRSSFAEERDLYEVWRAYLDDQQENEMELSISEFGCPTVSALLSYNKAEELIYTYQGVVAGALYNIHNIQVRVYAFFLLGSVWKPIMEISRSKISSLPLEVLVASCGILNRYQIVGGFGEILAELYNFEDISLKSWREVRIAALDQWLMKNMEPLFTEIEQELQNPMEREEAEPFTIAFIYNNDNVIIYKYLAAYFQDNYKMTINYEAGQIISFSGKEEDMKEDIFDLFPPMMFCKAASDESRQYICSKRPLYRRGITVDHPFIIWLMDNAVQLKQYYQRQFQQIVESLCRDSAESVIQNCNEIRKQLIALPEHHGVDVMAFPELSKDDFWSVDDE